MPGPGRESPAYARLRHNAALALAAAERDPADGESHAMSALIHTALMAETFLDFLGAHLDRDWSSKGRRFSRYKRLRVFRLALGIDGDIRARPWRSIFDAFDFHDLMLHGRIDAYEKREALGIGDDELSLYSIGADWQNFSTIENARRIFEDADDVIKYLYSVAEGGKAVRIDQTRRGDKP